ncbi:MAG: ABC transporter permease [Candidatus Odinarchaeota archaeon]
MSEKKAVGTRQYIATRIVQTIVVWFGIITLNFFIFRIMPGDPRGTLIAEHMPPEVVQAIALRFGLDQPIAIQFVLYIVNLFRGDLGESFSHYGQPVIETIFAFRFWNTVILMGTSILIALIVAIIMGVIAASRRDKVIDVGSTTVFLVTYSMPVFWLGLMILYYFGFILRVIPLAGTITRGIVHVNIFHYIADYLWHMTGPLVVLTLSFIGGFYLIMRDSVLDVFTQDYILAARAKGLKERAILYGHAMRNAMLPMVSVIAVNMPFLISGATITETVFSWSGLGLLTYNSVVANDWPVLQGIFLFLATVAVLSNFVADILYLYLDPRIRY